MPVTLSGHGKKPMRRSALSPCVHAWCVPSSPFAVICCGTGASAWVGQVGTRCALTGRFTVLLGVNVPANHGAQQAVGQRRSALPRDCSPIARHIAQPIDIHKEAHNVAQRMRVLSFDSLRSALPCAAYVSKRPRCDETSRLPFSFSSHGLLAMPHRGSYPPRLAGSDSPGHSVSLRMQAHRKLIARRHHAGSVRFAHRSPSRCRRYRPSESPGVAGLHWRGGDE